MGISKKQVATLLTCHFQNLLYQTMPLAVCLKYKYDSIQSCLGDEQDYHKKEVIRLTNQIDECKETLKKMYLDQINNILDYELWVNLKNEYEVKLNRLSVELQKHNTANTNFLDTGLKILEVCRKASLPSS